jgi:hypothetical protein
MAFSNLVNKTKKHLQSTVALTSGVDYVLKAIPLQAWTGPEGFRRLGLPYFKTIGI